MTPLVGEIAMLTQWNAAPQKGLVRGSLLWTNKSPGLGRAWPCLVSSLNFSSYLIGYLTYALSMKYRLKIINYTDCV
jgi:hypothetical protein